MGNEYSIYSIGIMQRRTFLQSDSIPTYLRKDMQFEGTLQTTEATLIEGSFSGTLMVKNTLYVLNSASLKKNISADTCSVQGAHVAGIINVKHSLKIIKNSAISGNINAADIEIESGTKIDATINVTQSHPTESKKDKKMR